MNRTTKNFLEASRRHFGLAGLLRSLLVAGSLGASLATPALAEDDTAPPRQEQRGDEAQPGEPVGRVALERMP